DAIEQLKPPRDVSPDALAWKSYRFLHLRCVRSLGAAAVARELGLSTRQCQRIQVAAVASVGAVLWGKRQVAETGDSNAEGPGRDVREPGTVVGDPLLNDELAALLARPPGELEAFPTTVRGVIDTIAPILESRRVAVDLDLDRALDQ